MPAAQQVAKLIVAMALLFGASFVAFAFAMLAALRADRLTAANIVYTASAAVVPTLGACAAWQMLSKRSLPLRCQVTGGVIAASAVIFYSYIAAGAAV